MLSSNRDSSLREDQRYATWLPTSKTKIFQKLFDDISNKAGGVVLAKNYIGLSNHTLDDLYKQSISYETAQKILLAHKKLIGKK